MTSGIDYEKVCPGCDRPIGDHTIRGYGECLERVGFNWDLPMEEVPDGPMMFPNVEGHLVGEITVAAAFIETGLGPQPALQFRFTGPGAAPMSRVSLPPITLVMDEQGLRKVANLVHGAVSMAIKGTRARR